MITPADVAVSLGRPIPTGGSIEYLQWSIWIGDARMLIADRLGDLSLLDQAKLDYVTRLAVAALVRQPDNATQVDVAVDGMNVSKRYSTGTGQLSILDEWWTLLDQAGSGEAFSFGPECAGTRW